MNPLKNNKGFTLVEMIAAVAVFSIVAVILLTGFLIVARLVSRSNDIKSDSVQGEYEIESKSADSSNTQTETETIRIEIPGKNDVIIGGYYIEETNEYSQYKAFIQD